MMRNGTANGEDQPRIDDVPPDMRVAVLSDTHGLLRESVLPHLAGVTHILHAGDVGDPAILEQLNAIAPTTAIRGNIDQSGPCAALPATEMVTLGGVTVYLLHSVSDLDLSPEAAGVQIVVSGHSHRPTLEERRGVTYLNPGSIGPRRFSLPISMAVLYMRDDRFRVEFLTLEA